jgi:hypothetical protein
MIQKRLIVPDRVRQLPAHWSWVDHRLVRDQHLSRCEPTAWTLYLFLVTVGDAQGLSYYSDASIRRSLQLDASALAAARHQLLQAGLIAYAKPLYQVLDLAPVPSAPPADRSGQTRSLSEVLAAVLQQGGQP